MKKERVFSLVPDEVVAVLRLLHVTVSLLHAIALLRLLHVTVSLLWHAIALLRLLHVTVSLLHAANSGVLNTVFNIDLARVVDGNSLELGSLVVCLHIQSRVVRPVCHWVDRWMRLNVLHVICPFNGQPTSNNICCVLVKKIIKNKINNMFTIICAH